MADAGMSTVPGEGALARFEGEGKTAMLLAVDGQLAGVLAVADTLKDHAVEAIRALKDMGIEVAMLTGDNRRTGEALARQAGIDRVIADVLAAGAAERVREPHAAGQGGARVGRGRHAGPARAQAGAACARD